MIGCPGQQLGPKRPPGSFSHFHVLIFIYLFEYETIFHRFPSFFMHNKLVLGKVYLQPPLLAFSCTVSEKVFLTKKILRSNNCFIGQLEMTKVCCIQLSPRTECPSNHFSGCRLNRGLYDFLVTKWDFLMGVPLLKKQKKQEMVFSTIEQTNLLKLSSEKQPFLLLI